MSILKSKSIAILVPALFATALLAACNTTGTANYSDQSSIFSSLSHQGSTNTSAAQSHASQGVN